jgi:glycosyltransferase involved in cell wall biosynthesis
LSPRQLLKQAPKQLPKYDLGMKLLIELRPALEGHAGIPQETRLLFRGLGQLDGVEVQGLIQSGSKFLAPGLPAEPEKAVRLPAHEQIDRLSRVVVSLQPPVKRGLLGRVLRLAQRLSTSARFLGATLLGFRHSLGAFNPAHFHDFVWRSLFAKTLPVEDFHQITTAAFRVAQIPYGAMHACGLAARRMGFAVWLPSYPRLATQGLDVMLVQTPYPASVAQNTHLVVRYFDAVPLLMPHTIVNKAHHQALHYQALRHNVAQGAYFVCCSETTRRDLMAVFPEVAERAVTIACMLSHHYFVEESSAHRVGDIVAKRFNASVHSKSPKVSKAESPLTYLLMVSTLEPRKNHTTLLEAWEELQRGACPNLKLIFVGSLGWDHEPIVKVLQPWLDRGDAYLLEGVPADELRLLYRHAQATVCPSYAEGFGYAGVEAMRCGGVVVASDLPVHREVYGDAAEYFNPYSAQEAARVIGKLLAPEQAERRLQLVAAGQVVSERYTPQQLLPQWQAFLLGLPPTKAAAEKAGSR